MLISIEQVINRAKQRLRLNNTENDAYLEKLINEGAQSMGSQRTEQIFCKPLEIDCFKAKLPDNFTEFVSAQFPQGTCSGTCCSSLTGDELAVATLSTGTCTGSCPVWYVKAGVLTDFSGQGSPCGIYSNYFNIQGQYLVLPSSTTATEVKIWYKGWNTDSYGIFAIYTEWERALSAYAAAQYSLEYIERYNPLQQGKWESEWIAQKNKIVGVENVRQFNLESHDIEQMMHSIVSNTWLQGVYNIPGGDQW
jgi:hypothetical protein